MVALLVAVGIAALVGIAMHDRYPKGHGPFDVLPGGLGTRSSSSKQTAPSTKIVYETWAYPPGPDGKQFHVAARADGKLGWVAYWVNRTPDARNPAGGGRTFYAGWTPANGDQVALLRQDFGV